MLEGERLEIELVGDVEIGRDRLGVRVDHDRLVTLLAQSERGTYAAVIELHALPDPIRPASQNHNRLLAGPGRFAFFVVTAVEIRRGRRKLTCTGIHHLVGRYDS